MQDPRNLSWCQFNQSRKFPLLFGSTAVSTCGHFRIPDDLLVSLYLSCGVNAQFSDPGGFYIGRIIYWRDGIELEIHYDGKKIAETTIPLTTGQTVATLLGHGDSFFYGHVVLGGTSGLELQPVGEWEFDHAATALDPFCIRPSFREISALYVKSSGMSHKLLGPFYGAITLAEGENIALTVRSAELALSCLAAPPSGAGTEVTIHAVADDANDSESRLRTLHGVEPDDNGNIALIGRDCLDIRAEQATLIFDDTCAKPCCTCTELVPIEDKIQELESSITAMRAHLDTLKIQAEFLTQSLSAAR